MYRFQTVVLRSTHPMTKETAKAIVVGTWVVSVAFSVPYGWDHRVFYRNATLVNDTTYEIPGCYPAHGELLWWKVCFRS